MAWLIVFIFIYGGINNKPVETGTPAEMQAGREARKEVARQNLQKEEFVKNQKSKANRVMGAWKGAVKEILVDPDSADFKDLVFVLDVSGTAFACGEVNSKNQMGGYTGYKGFITAGLKDYTYIEGETKGFSKFWNEVCVNGQRL